MHRSGTSALTGALHACGAAVGADGDLTGSSAENPHGFFERRDLRKICDTLLQAAEADWWKVSGFSRDAVARQTLDQQRAAFTRLVGQMSQESTWVVKEPRLCLLLPLLIDLVPSAICVFVYRNPIDVAKSLRTRNRISLQHGVALWEKYNLSAIEAMKDRVCATVSYHELIADPQTALKKLVAQLSDLGAKELRAPTDPSVFIDRSLQRSRHQPAEMAILTPEQWALWNFLANGSQPDSNFNHASSTGQKYLLEDLEHQFQINDDLQSDQGSNSVHLYIRSKKVRAIARELDRIACGIADITQTLIR